MPNGGSNGNGHSFWPTWTGNKLFTLLLTILFAYAIVLLGTFIMLNTLKADRVGKADEPLHTITIDGSGKVTGTPNIATVTLGLQVTKEDVASAQKENTDKMNAFSEALKKLGIDPADIQTTDYSIFPQYDYSQSRQVLTGYTVSQNVTVKIRDLTKISSVLGTAGEKNLNQVFGLNFTIEDPETLRVEARDKALTQAEEKAAALARSLGVKIVRVVGFSEAGGGSPVPMYYAKEVGLGAGGGPDISTGSLDVTANVSVTYEIE